MNTKVIAITVGSLIAVFTIVLFGFAAYIEPESQDKIDDVSTKPILHYSEFDGEVFVENQCTPDLSCYGFDDNNQKIILDCSDMVVHGCSDFQDFEIEE